ncbi:TadA family conjugal transfer-associated ATPase [Parenemella sanctibonifatiensis]|uniref:Pilus assembly protein CpaF n=1 Tax=Parenemella sanctibonifatiensis TaxID=2016505 RepID=A0A255EMB6_9ACTN|nr:TadA family conjugal transfer-associated ATPase [Parenemella sanctibonifatiensis]OYN92644.1 pilus assembly protein CpaF [Parenemella sanctibonifatiensis]
MAGVDLELLRSELAELTDDPGVVDVARVLRRHGQPVDEEGVLAAVRQLRRHSRGAGLLDDLLRLDGVTDVLVNGPEEVYLDRGQGLERCQVQFEDDAAVRQLATRIAAAAGRRLDEGSPYVDARLPDGTRVHAILAPVADPGTCISLRVPARRTLDLAAWAGDAAGEAAVAAVGDVVAQRASFLVTGGTGSGKTTLLSSMLALVDPGERIVVVEDSREINPRHPHLVRLEARPANAEGRGRVDLTDLIRQALRMRPDRLVVGEVRGAELTDLLTALNTGHEGGCGTVHANGVAELPARLAALGALAGWQESAVRAQALAALDVIVHVERRGGQRRIAEIGVLTTGPGGELSCVTALRFDPGPAAADAGRRTVHEPVRRGPGHRQLSERLGW